MSSSLVATSLPSGAAHLPDWGLIRAHGADARRFLHGQLTQDVLHLDAGTARLAGYCSAKGRLLASFVMWSAGEETVMLACSADVLQATLKRLRMFVLRAKCQLDDVSAEWRLWGLAGDSAAGVQPWSVEQFAAALRIGLPPAALQDGGSVPLALRLQSVAETDVPTPALDPSLWAGLEAASGVPRITAATSELFVPQMVNLEVVGGVNFQKGCYPGQEVVARSQYRGTTKRRAVLLAGTAAVAAGQEVFHSADPDQPAGAVVLAGAAPAGGSLLLASVKLDALEAGSLHAGVAGGALLTPLPLPYRLPAEAA